MNLDGPMWLWLNLVVLCVCVCIFVGTCELHQFNCRRPMCFVLYIIQPYNQRSYKERRGRIEKGRARDQCVACIVIVWVVFWFRLEPVLMMTVYCDMWMANAMEKYIDFLSIPVPGINPFKVLSHHLGYVSASTYIFAELYFVGAFCLFTVFN